MHSYWATSDDGYAYLAVVLADIGDNLAYRHGQNRSFTRLSHRWII
jgi:hypothetical protein